MIILIPESVDFIISTTDTLVKYSERDETQVELDVLKIEDYVNREKYTSISILFNTVAELRCCSLNFHETFYDNSEVFNLDEEGDALKFWEKNGYHPDSGFYQVDESEWLNNSKVKYDPQNNLGLKHYLIMGNDSYIELLAKDYSIK